MSYRIITLAFLLVFSSQSMAKSHALVGTWGLSEADNTHISRTSAEHQFQYMFLAEFAAELRFYANGKLLLVKAQQQGTWKKEKQGYSATTIADGKKNIANLSINGGKLRFNFDANSYLIYKKKNAKKVAKQDTDIARVKSKIPYDQIFRTAKDFMGYFHFILISKDGKIYTMGTNKQASISATAFKKSAAIQELLVDKADTRTYTITPKGIYTDMDTLEAFTVISPQKVKFRNKVYRLQR